MQGEDLEKLAHECYASFLNKTKQHPSANNIRDMLSAKYKQKVDDDTAMRLLIAVCPKFYTSFLTNEKDKR